MTITFCDCDECNNSDEEKEVYDLWYTDALTWFEKHTTFSGYDICSDCVAEFNADYEDQYPLFMIYDDDIILNKNRIKK